MKLKPCTGVHVESIPPGTFFTWGDPGGSVFVKLSLTRGLGTVLEEDEECISLDLGEGEGVIRRWTKNPIVRVIDSVEELDDA